MKDSFVFTEEIMGQGSGFSIGSLAVDPLFNNIPLEEIIEICTISFS